MKRKLIKQMCHEWRDNIWLVLSLMIVFTVVWGGLGMIYLETRGLFEPTGYDCTDVYSMNVRIIEKSSNYYDPEGNDRKEDFKILLDRLKQHPAVESVMYHWGGLPYSYDYMGNNLYVDGDSIVAYSGNVRQASPEIVDVLRIKSLTGASPTQLKEMLSKGEILISNTNFLGEGKDPISLKGKMVYFSGDPTKRYRVGDVIQHIRRNDYEESFGGTIILPNDAFWGMIAVRVKPGMGQQFEKGFKDNRDLRISRNVFLTELKSMDEVREANQREIEINLRQFVVLISFVLLTIFLGLLGTFWFRIQQRIGEIAIRKICGATRRDILRRIITEGFLLLLIGVAISSAVMWIFILPELIEMVGSKSLGWKLLWCEAGAFVLVMAGIIVSLLYPAYRAMRIEPALAIKAE